ncbi:MAG: alpha-galactosidase [Tannerella sp.]|jgi:alpha-galactosidase|nr:alpha-galactosidase [Tannerella sp.]
MKNKLRSFIILFILLIPVCISGQVKYKFTHKPVEITKWIHDQFGQGKNPPFSFVYGDRHSKDFIGKWSFSSEKIKGTESGVESYSYMWTDKQTGLKIVCDVKGYPHYRAVEWVLRFTNTSDRDCPTLKDVKVIDMDFQYPSAGDITLHYADGSDMSKADFHPRKKVLAAGETMSISPQRGRSSDVAFPFFNIESPSVQGVMVAVGWTGTWYSDFRKTGGNSVSLASGMKWLETYLHAEETIRTPSICLLFWNGEDRMTGHNQFRRFVLNHQTHKINGKPARYPVSNSFNYGDPHPCNEYTCLTTDYALAIINRYKRFKLVPEVFWLDAGWYIKAADVANNKDWSNTVGNWEVDRERFPDGLKPVSDAVHEVGAKFMVWFEPERVFKDSDWGIKLRKWMLDAQGTKNYLYDLGNKEARDWLCRFIGDMMEENGIDYYRQDFNMKVDNFWKENDEPGRTGIREIRHIEGLYAFWDYLLKRFPEAIIDNCASGGRRIDFETIKRSAPLWRTDYHYGEPVGYQCHTYGLNFFLPLTGTGVQKSDRFTFRSSLGTSVVYNWKITDSSSSFIEMQRCREEFNEVRPYFYEDYYPLTTVDDMTSDQIWLAYQLHRPSDETGFIVAFRREHSTDQTIHVKLSALQPDKSYLIENYDTGEVLTKTGKELSTGLELTLNEARSSLLLKYKAGN